MDKNHWLPTSRLKAFGLIVAILLLMLVTQGFASIAALIGQAHGQVDAFDHITLEDIDTVLYGRWLLVAFLLNITLLWMLRLAQPNFLMPWRQWQTPRWPLSIVGSLALAIGISVLFTPFNLSDSGTTDLFTGIAHQPCGVLALCVFGPISEEMAFRDGILRHLIRGGMGRAWAVVLSGLVFGLVHGNMMQAMPACLLGIVLGIIYLHTGDIRYTVVVHILNNSLSTALMLYPEIDGFIAKLPTWSLITAGCVICAIGIGVLIQWKRPRA